MNDQVTLRATNHTASNKHSSHGNYGKFVAMVLTSSVLMYAAMYLNTYALDHVFFSWIRFFMTMLMTGIMGVVMLLFMRGMY